MSSKKRIDAATRANQKGLSIVRICQVMGVARSSFYHKQKISIREIRDNQLAQWIKLIEDKFFYTIGRRRMGALIGLVDYDNDINSQLYELFEIDEISQQYIHEKLSSRGR